VDYDINYRQFNQNWQLSQHIFIALNMLNPLPYKRIFKAPVGYKYEK
jgi:hypothetical protein